MPKHLICDGRLTIDSADDASSLLIRSADRNDWEAVQGIVSISERIKLNRDAVGHILRTVIKDSKWMTIEPRLVGAKAKYKWNIIKSILEMTGENKPSRDAVESTLLHAQKKCEWDIVKFILEMKGENKPGNHFDMGSLLIVTMQAFHYSPRFALLEDIARLILDISGDNKPNKKAVNKALLYAVYYLRRNIVQHILDMTGKNKPDQQAVGRALLEAVNLGHRRNMVQLILKMSGDNRPDKKALGEALIAMFRGPCFDEDLPLIWPILEMTGDYKPNKKVIATVLKSRQCLLKVAVYILERPDVYNLDRDILAKVLNSVVYTNRVDIVKLIMNMQQQYKPNRAQIEKAFSAAVDQANLDVLTFFESRCKEDMPRKKTVEKAFELAIRKDNIPLCGCLFRVLQKIKSNESTDTKITEVRLFNKARETKGKTKSHTDAVFSSWV